jgi:hypothetical protein
MTVLGATEWATNADMIVDCAVLGYIKADDRVLDLTYGRGKWWTKYIHDGPFFANVDANGGEVVEDALTEQTVRWGHGITWFCRDYRDMGTLDPFDVITFDPPYVAMGGRTTSTLPDFMDRYGLEQAQSSPRRLHEYNRDGLEEAYRLCKPGGFVMTKVADYVSSGRLQLASHWLVTDALEMGFNVQDKLTHVGHVRPQPGGRKVKHARQNTSTLWVLQKPKSRKKSP